MLNLFYEEPDPDRWFRNDRYLRGVVRRLIRGPRQPGGQERVFLNLRAGLDLLRIPYRVNDYSYARNNPGVLACIIGKPHVLQKLPWKNPILFGAAVWSHPIDDPELLRRLAVKRILVPGPWMETMCRPYWGDLVSYWPTGIDASYWSPSAESAKQVDVLIYDKVRWERERYEPQLLLLIREHLRAQGKSFEEIRYGFYREAQFRALLARSKTMIFVCEHETQGIAYQQALSCDVPIFAWDRGGEWRDPAYHPHRVRFAPVSSVPYWDDRCGEKFSDVAEFTSQWGGFWDRFQNGQFEPREYILDNLTLEKCALKYAAIAKAIEATT